VVENKWRAQRYGIHGTFVTLEGAVSVADMLDRVVEALSEDASALGCTAEMERCRAIVSFGTSADAQLAVFESSRAGSSREAALHAVTEWIAKATLE
jgi:carboxylate-amine ligase